MDRTCKTCGQVKNRETDFYSFVQDGVKCFASYCKPCALLRNKINAAKNPERERKRSKLKCRRLRSRKCQSCSVPNDDSVQFHQKTLRGDTYTSSYCESCWQKKLQRSVELKKAKKKRYARKYRNYLNEYHRKNYQKNLTKKRSQSREWARKNRLRNATASREAQKRWRKANPEKTKAMFKAWRIRNPDKMLDKTKRRMLAKRGATTPESRLVTRVWFRERCAEQDHKCVYCGEKTTLQMEHVLPIARGGKHVRENVVGACLPCNCSKKHRTISEWKPETAIHSYGLELASA